MKKLVVVSIMAAMLLGLVAVAAMADTTNWIMLIQASNMNNTQKGSQATIGWQTGKTDLVDSGEYTSASDPFSGQSGAYIVSVLSDGRWSKSDYRQSFGTSVGNAAYKVYNMKIYYTDLGGGAINTTKLAFTAALPFPYDKGDIRIVCDKINGSSFGSYSSDMSFNAAKPITTGSWISINTTGADKANAIDLTIYAPNPVPEPSSMLALASGLFGMAGFAIRRRK